MTHGTYASIFKVVDTAVVRTLFCFLTSGSAFIHTPMQIEGADQMTWNGSGGVNTGTAMPMGVWLLGVMRKDTGTQFPRFSLYRYDTGAWVHSVGDGAVANHASIAATDLIASDTGATEIFNGDIALFAAWSNHLPWAASAGGDAALEQAGLQWDLLAWLNSYGHPQPPRFVDAGAGVITEASGGALSPLSPAIVNAGDLLIIFAYYEGITTAPSTPSNFTLLDGPRTLASNIGRCWVFGKIADGTEDGATNALGTPAVTTMRAARCYRFTGVRSDTVANVVGGFGFAGPASTATVSDVGVTTPEPNCLAVNLITVADDNALVSYTGETGGDWTEAIAEYTSAATTPDYAQQLQTAYMATAATVDGGTQTMAAADPWGVVGFYIRGGDGVAANSPSWLVLHDQQNVTTTVLDITGNGGSQASRTGTTVVDGPPAFGYGADVIVSPGHVSAASTNAPATQAVVAVVANAATTSVQVNALTATVTAVVGTTTANVRPNSTQAIVTAVANNAYKGANASTATVVVKNDPSHLCMSHGGSCTTPDHADFAVTDLDLEIGYAAHDWTPFGPEILIGQTLIIGDSGMTLVVDTDGDFILQWSATDSVRTTNPTGFANYSGHVLRGTLDVDNGSGQHVATLFLDGSQVDQFTNSGTTTVFNSAQALNIGNGVLTGRGRYTYAKLRSSINGTEVANPNFANLAPGTTSFQDAAGKTWTVNSPAVIQAGPDVVVEANAITATVAVSASGQSTSIRTNAAQAVVNALANNATISTANDVNAPATPAIVTTVANDVDASIQTNAIQATIAAVANNANANVGAIALQAIATTVGNNIGATVQTNAVQAIINAVANNATVSTTTFVDVNATPAIITAVANDIDANVQVNAVQSVVAAVSNDVDASVSTNATQAVVVAASIGADESILVNPTQAIVSAVANNATISTESFTDAVAQTAVIVATANGIGATVQTNATASIVITNVDSDCNIITNAAQAVVTAIATQAVATISTSALHAVVVGNANNNTAQIVINAVKALVIANAINPSIGGAPVDEYPIDLEFMESSYSMSFTTDSYVVTAAEPSGVMTFGEAPATVTVSESNSVSFTTDSYALSFEEG
jgi:hypothetical protein